MGQQPASPADTPTYLDSYSLTYGHDELILWCDRPDHSDNDSEAETVVWRGYGGPNLLSEVHDAVDRHDAEQHGGVR